MKKNPLVFAFMFGIGIAASFLYYNFQTGDSTASGFLDWLSSLWTRITLKTESVTSNDPVVIATSVIANFEGFSPVVYSDAGNLAIGYGHDLVEGDGFDSASTITESDALALLQQDLSNYVQCVNNNVTASLTPNQFAALYSFTYNVGCAAFQKSTLLKKINTGDFSGASAEFLKWDISQGQVVEALVERRTSEQSLFNS